MAPAENPFRLLDLAQELQDMIAKSYFSAVFTVYGGNPDPPYLEALRTSPHPEQYQYARKAFYKHATFQLRDHHLKKFLDWTKPYTRHIKEIRLVSEFWEFPVNTFKGRSVEFAMHLVQEERRARTRMAGLALAIEHFNLGDLEAEKSLKSAVIKVLVYVTGGGNGEDVDWEKWTNDVDQTRKCAFEIAGIPKALRLSLRLS